MTTITKEEENLRILNLTSGATKAEIKSAFMKLSLVWHPDKNSNRFKEDVEFSNNKYEEIKTAYEYLMQDHEESEETSSVSPHVKSKTPPVHSPSVSTHSMNSGYVLDSKPPDSYAFAWKNKTKK